MKYIPQYLFDKINDVDVKGFDIIIDTREKSEYSTAFINRFIELLNHFKYKWIKTKLPAGDILINRGRGLNIERKTVGDLIGTAFGNREDGNALESELKKLVDSDIYGGYEIPTCLCCENGRTITIKQIYEKKVVEKTKYEKKIEVVEYIEKRSFSYKQHNGKRRSSKLYPNSWIGITKKVQHFTSYYEFSGVDHFISWIISRLKKEIQYEKDVIKGNENIVTLKMNNKVNKMTLSEQQQYIIESISGFGSKGSVNALEWAGTLRLFFLNVKKPENLTELGINKPTADHVLLLLDNPFDRNDKTKIKKRKRRF